MRPLALCTLGAALCVVLSGCGSERTGTATDGAADDRAQQRSAGHARERAAERSGGASERRDEPGQHRAGHGGPWHGTDRLEQSRATFAEHGDDYRFKLTSWCATRDDARERFTVTVHRGTVSDVVPHPSNTTVDTRGVPSVEQLFDELAQAAGGGSSNSTSEGTADRVDVAFSPRGYPRKISIDPDAGVPDDETCYHVHGLHFLTPNRS